MSYELRGGAVRTTYAFWSVRCQTVMRAGSIVVIVVVFAILAIASYFFYPVYPSPRPLCELLADRHGPHQGAVVAVSGRLYGSPYGQFYLVARCTAGPQPVVVEISPFAATSPMSRSAIAQLTSFETSARAGVVARVEFYALAAAGVGARDLFSPSF